MKKYLFVTIMSFVILVLHTPLSYSVSFTVNSTNDEADSIPGDGVCQSASGVCTLRAAVDETNSLSGGDEVTLPAGSYTLTSGELTIQDLSITGDGATSTTIDANGSVTGEGAFTVSNSLALSGVKLTGGSGSNGAIYSRSGLSGAITLDGVDISGNNCTGVYIHSSALLILKNSSVSRNVGNNGAGGIYIHGGGSITIDNSTIANNSSVSSGVGLYYHGDSILTITNSTIANNIPIDSETRTTNSNVYISNTTGTTIIENSILAGDLDSETVALYCSIGAPISQGYNIISDTSYCTITSAAGDQIGTSSSPLDAQLDVLANNGGTTETLALKKGSPAIDAGDPSGCTDADGVLLTTDQRGYTRPMGAACDIGAYEYDSSLECGDGVVDSGEECDDGNKTDGDGCDSTCKSECGNSHLDTGEACDDGDTASGDGCNATCQIEYCGDKLVNNAGTETCDDGNTTSGDGCSSTCQREVCGDGIVNKSGETCDDGNKVSNDGCSSTCKVEVCGDGIKQTFETCDDGNIVGNDGCSKLCTLEYCGDKIVESGLGETCDDGNTTNGDGCGNDCMIEHAPVANAGADGSVYTDKLKSMHVLINGSASSDQDGDPLSYAWTMMSVPAGSTVTTASIANPAAAVTYFTADKKGAYTLRLKVNDSDGYSATDSVTIILK